MSDLRERSRQRRERAYGLDSVELAYGRKLLPSPWHRSECRYCLKVRFTREGYFPSAWFCQYCCISRDMTIEIIGRLGIGGFVDPTPLVLTRPERPAYDGKV